MQTYKYFDIHTHKRSENVCTLSVYSCRTPSSIPLTGLYSYGLHPYDAAKQSLANIDFSDPRLIAIGEVGLDFRLQSTIHEQIAIFERQLSIAIQHHKPVIIHCVKAIPQTLRMLNLAGIEAFVFHGFNSSLSNALNIIKSEGYVSFGASLINNAALQHTFKQIFKLHPNKILLETDESPISIIDIYMQASTIIGKPLETLEKTIRNNSLTFLNL